MKKFFLALLAALITAPSVLKAANPTWTILIYGHGDHNLSPSLVEDFLEMQRSMPTTDFRIVVQTDYQANDLSTYEGGLPKRYGKGVTRWLVTPSGEKKVVSQVLQRLPELNSDKPTNLAAFLQWGLANYPADRIGVVLWDHGGSWKGYGSDTKNGTIKPKTLMNLNQIHAGLSGGLGNRVVDFLSFDACLMANQEVIAQLNRFSQIFIANAEIDYGPGWDYEAALGWLRANPAASMAEFAKAEAKAYARHHAGSAQDRYFQAHFAFDNEVARAQFVPAAKRFATVLRHGFTEAVARARRDAPTYYATFQAGEVGAAKSAFVDLPDLADRVAKDPRSGPTLRRAARAVVAGTDAMRLAAVRGVQKRGAGGVNVFLPFDDLSSKSRNEFSRMYADKEIGWSRVIRAAILAKRRAPAPMVEIPSETVEGTAGSGVPFSIKVPRGRPYAVQADFLVQGGNVVLGEAGRALLNEKPGTAKLVWDAKVVEAIAGGRSILLPASEINETPMFITSAAFSAPGYDTPFFGMLTIEEKKNGRLVLAGLDASPDSDVAPRDFQITPETKITPRFLQTADNRLILGEETFQVPQGDLDKLPIRLGSLPSGRYELKIEAENVYGRKSEPVYLPVNIR